MTDTIFAVATGAGRAAVAVIRMSGPAAGAALAALAGPLPPPRLASLRRVREHRDGPVLDQALVLWFPGPSSFTGQDSAEIQCHGGRAVVAAILRALGARPGCRPADPGEFTRRALHHGKLSLPAVEGLADLIAADTEGQRRQAQRQLDGALGAWVADQRRVLLAARAAAESAIDFADEPDVAGDFAREVQAHVARLRQAIAGQRAGLDRAERVREGLVVALAGPPNAGKSTLLNALAQREVAIVSPLPGTTRDAIAIALDLDGFLVELVDTAGLRDTDDPIEQQGVARARDRAARADLVLWLCEVGAPQPPDPALAGRPLWRVATKIDLGAPAPSPPRPDHAIAAMTGEGVPALVAALTALVGDPGGGDGGATRERHRAALLRAEAALARLAESGPDGPLELAAEQLREAAEQLDSLMGRIESEEVLGAIFERFCVGK